jgi:integrase
VLKAEVSALHEAIRQAKGEEPSTAPPPAAVAPAMPAAAPTGTPQDATRAPSAAPGGAPATTPAQDPKKARRTPLASALAEPFLKHRKAVSGTSNQVLGQERDTLRIFRDICGDRPLGDYGRADMTHFHETARMLPALRGRSPTDKDKPTAEFIARAATSGEKRITDKTLKRHHSALAQFFRYAMDRGHLDHGQFTALVSDHRFKASKGAKTQRDPWSPDELTKLFASPVWTGADGSSRRSRPGPHIVRDGKFWLPILALFHGARLEELADLYGRDVGREGDVWFVRLEEREGDEDGGERRLKTKNAARVIPLHPELIRLGFLRYVAQTAPNPDDPLFPELEPQGPDRKRGPRITRWFVEYRRDIKLYRPGVGMHSFRHTARTRLSDLTEQTRERHLNYLFGHSGSGSEGATRYDKGPGLRAVAETLGLLSYPELDLTHLHIGAMSGELAM